MRQLRTIIVVTVAAMLGMIAAPPEGPGDRTTSVLAWIGNLRPTGVSVVAVVPTAGSVRLLVNDAGEAMTPWMSDVQQVRSERGGVVRFETPRLRPWTRYTYEVLLNGRGAPTAAGSFQTSGRGPRTFTIAFGNCARTGSDAVVFETIHQHDPLLFLHAGDMHYADVATNDPDAFRERYEEVLASPRQGALYRNVPLVYTWDDHDFGGQDSARNALAAPAARAIYRERVPHVRLAAGEGNLPIYHAFTVGRVRFVVSDVRSERNIDPVTGEPTMLGPVQLRWLKQEFASAWGRGQLVVWVSPSQWIDDATPGADNWGGFGAEREEIANFIARAGVRPPLVVLGGDAHMVAADDGTNSDYASIGASHFPVLHAGPLDQEARAKGGPYSEGVVEGTSQFGLLRFVDDGGRNISVAFSGRRADDTEVLRWGTEISLGRAGSSGAIGD